MVQIIITCFLKKTLTHLLVLQKKPHLAKKSETSFQ